MFGIPEWAMGVGFIILVGSLGRALFGGFGGFSGGRRVHGRKASHRELTQGFDDLEKRLAALEDAQAQLGTGGVDALRSRLSELEERLDFAERLLAQHREGERLPPPKS